MSSVVFILGAGASKKCGAPLMADFLDVAYDLWKTNVVVAKSTHFEKVFKARGALQAVHSKAELDLNNIESVFASFEIAKILGKLPNFEKDEISKTINSLKELIVVTLENTINFPLHKGKIGSPIPYGAFADLLNYLNEYAKPRQTTSIITFNYDIAIDVAMFLYELTPVYYLKNESNLDTNKIPLLKLHGSMNWGQCTKCNEVIPLAINDYLKKISFDPFFTGSNGRVTIGSHLEKVLKHCNSAVKPQPVIVPPTWNKAEHHQILAKVWSRAAHELEQAEFIFIMGYSLPETDAFFRLLYALGTVGVTPLRKIAIFNPDKSGVVRKRFEGLMGPGARDRFEYFEKNFEEAVQDIRKMFQVN